MLTTAPFGTPGAIQSDARFGDIRIAAYNMGAGAEAGAAPFALDAGTWSGDVELNTAASFGINGSGQYDLFTVMLHEAGHVFGLPDNTNPASVEDIQYLGAESGLGAADVTALQAIYDGPRSLDQLDGDAGIGQRSTALRLNSLANIGGALSMTVDADLSTLQDQDFYSFNTLLNFGGVDLTVRTAGISLMTPSVTVFNLREAGLSRRPPPPIRSWGHLDRSDRCRRAQHLLRRSAERTAERLRHRQLRAYDQRAARGEQPSGPHDRDGGLRRCAAASGLLNDDRHSNDSFATATVLPPLRPGPNGSSYETYLASIGDSTDVDYYELSAPAANSSTEVLTAMVWGVDNQLDPQVRVYDAQNNPVAAQILVNDGFNMVVQIANAAPSATYYVEVLPATAGAVGNYGLCVDVSPNAVALQSYASCTLNAAQSVTINTLVVTPRSQLLHFVLSADAADSTTSATVQMTITNATGQTVFTLAAASGQSFSGNVILVPGAYTVVFTASAGSGQPLPSVTYRLLGERLTDPDGPESTDPTQDPGGSSNTDPPDEDDWGDGSTTGVPPQDPTGDPYTTANTPVVSLYNPGDQTNLGGDQAYLVLTAADSASNPLDFSAHRTAERPGDRPEHRHHFRRHRRRRFSSNPYVVTITATDEQADADANQTFYWTVNPPVVTLIAPSDQTNLAGDQVYVVPSASASDGYALTYNVTGLPAGLTFDPNSGIITGTLASNAASASPYVVTITATDASSGVSANQAFNWTVNPPMVSLIAPSDQTNLAGDQVYVVPSASASDGYALTYNVTGLPPGLPSTLTAASSPGPSPATPPASPYVVTITATDASSGVSANQAVNWTVNPPMVSLIAPSDQTNLAGDQVYVVPSASASDGYALTYNVTGARGLSSTRTAVSSPGLSPTTPPAPVPMW